MNSQMRAPLAAIFLAVIPTAVMAAPSLCTPHEQVVFSCPLAGGKAVFVCAVESPKGHYQLVYRASTKHKVVLTLPELGAEGQAMVSGNQSQGARGGDGFVRFNRGDFSYVAQDIWGGPAVDGPGCGPRSCGFKGVIIERAGRVVSRSECITPGETFAEGVLARYGVPVSDLWPE
jgi:hypothetical protein